MGGLSALGAAFYSVGIPQDSVLQYETQVKNGKLVLVAHGTPEEVAAPKTCWISLRRLRRRFMASNWPPSARNSTRFVHKKVPVGLRPELSETLQGAARHHRQAE